MCRQGDMEGASTSAPKKIPVVKPGSFFWCARRDLNSHTVAPASPSSWCVCHSATRAVIIKISRDNIVFQENTFVKRKAHPAHRCYPRLSFLTTNSTIASGSKIGRAQMSKVIDANARPSSTATAITMKAIICHLLIVRNC